MIIEKEYRGMSYTTEIERTELGYSVIYKYYRTKEKLIDGTVLYGIQVESKQIYNQNQFIPEQRQTSIAIGKDKNIANQIIEIFKINRIGTDILNEVYEDMCVVSTTKMLQLK